MAQNSALSIKIYKYDHAVLGVHFPDTYMVSLSLNLFPSRKCVCRWAQSKQTGAFIQTKTPRNLHGHPDTKKLIHTDVCRHILILQHNKQMYANLRTHTHARIHEYRKHVYSHQHAIGDITRKYPTISTASHDWWNSRSHNSYMYKLQKIKLLSIVLKSNLNREEITQLESNWVNYWLP